MNVISWSQVKTRLKKHLPLYVNMLVVAITVVTVPSVDAALLIDQPSGFKEGFYKIIIGLGALVYTVYAVIANYQVWQYGRRRRQAMRLGVVLSSLSPRYERINSLIDGVCSLLSFAFGMLVVPISVLPASMTVFHLRLSTYCILLTLWSTGLGVSLFAEAVISSHVQPMSTNQQRIFWSGLTAFLLVSAFPVIISFFDSHLPKATGYVLGTLWLGLIIFAADRMDKNSDKSTRR